MEQQSCLLPRFSPELIFMIVGYNDPPDILALGLTCSDLHHRCRSLLAKHQDAYNKYRITSDLSPETAVDLLKETPTAEINRYHVRELEFWGTRLGWKDWRSWDPALSGNYQLAEEEPLKSALDAREVQRYIQKGLLWWNLTEEEIEDVQDSLEEGHEAWLKLLLISLCPRLHSIRFVKRKGDLYCMLAWIREAIQRSICCEWPPGFQSLPSMAVGISMGQLPHGEEEEYYDRFEEFSNLFHIPNLKIIYFSGLSCQEYMWEEHVWNEDLLPDGTSNVESLFLDDVEGGWDEYYERLSHAPKKLNTVVLRATDSLRGGLIDASSLVDSLAATNEMRRLIIYQPAAMENELYRQTDIFNNKSVEQITMAALDLDFRFAYTESNSMFRESDIPLAFLPNIEAVYIWGASNSPGDPERPSLFRLDLFLTELIESGVYKKLKVIYVEHVERTYRRFVKAILFDGGLDIAEWEKLAFRRTTAAGHKAGVHVCTLMNKDDGGYWKNFPARPDRFDIKTGPFAAERPERWKLNLYTGEWEPNCSGCGECEECLALYPSELWKENVAQRSNSS